MFPLRYNEHTIHLCTHILAPWALGIDGVAIAFTLGAGGADTSHKPPPLKRVCPVKPAPEHIVFVSL
jgi:hypothetical protein